jgi:hypothetical protein
MSISNITVILDRVGGATPRSPLAVFSTLEGFDCVFASTIRAKKRIATGTGYVGTVHAGMPRRVVRAMLYGGCRYE